MTADGPSPRRASAHWERVWNSRSPEGMSWFQARPETSLELIRATGMGSEGPIIDVGGGVSRLPDALLARGFSRLAVLDLSPTALAVAQERLGVRAVSVEWLVGDVRSFEPPHPFDVWHDRAVFHFLTSSADRLDYHEALLRTVPAGGHAIVGTFGPRGPERCSGLPVVRYDPASLAVELGPELELVESREEIHRTPTGAEQQFIFGRFLRTADRE